MQAVALSVLILTLAGAIVLSGILWLTIGSRLQLNEESSANHMLNLAAYALGAIPVMFVLVFFGLGA